VSGSKKPGLIVFTAINCQPILLLSVNFMENFMEGGRELRRKNIYKQMVDALGYQDDEGRGVTAISFGEVSSNL